MSSIRLIVICCVLPLVMVAQKAPDLSKSKDLNEKVELWRQYSNELLEAGEYVKMLDATQIGLTMLPPDSLRKRAMFSLFAGVALSGIGNEPEAEKYYLQTIQLAEKVDALNYQMTAMSQLDGIYANLRDHKRRLKIIQSMQEIARANQSEDFGRLTLSALSAYYSDMGNYDLAIQYRLDLVALHKKAFEKNPSELSHFVNVGLQLDNVGNFFNTTGRPEKALDYLYEADPYFDKIVDIEKKGRHYVYFMQAFRELGQLDSQRVYYHKIKETDSQKAIDNEWALANFSLAGFYADRGQADSALHYGLLAKGVGADVSSTNTKVQIAQVLGQAYSLKRQFRLAIQEYQYALSYNLEMDKENALYIRKGLADAYAALHLWDSAYVQLKLYTTLSDSLNLEVTDKNFAEVEGQYQNKLKQEQIKSQAAALSFARKQGWWLVGGVAALAVLSLLLLIIYRNKKRSAAKLDESNRNLNLVNASLEAANQTKAKLFGILSHDLRAPVSHVYQFLNIVATNPNALPEEQKAILSNKTQNATAALLNTLEDLLLWSKTQLNNFQVEWEVVALGSLITNVIQLQQLQLDAKQLQVVSKIPENVVLRSDANFLQTIIRNLLQNAIKASPDNALVSVYITDEASQLSLVIENTGQTFTQNDYEQIVQGSANSSKNGLGLQLVHDLAQKIDLDIRFESTEPELTRVFLNFNTAN